VHARELGVDVVWIGLAMRHDLMLEGPARLAGGDVDFPRLDIGARGRTGGGAQDVLYHLARHGVGAESAHRTAASEDFIEGHG
jgi:hypothetical protein